MVFGWFTNKVKKEEFEQHVSAVQAALNNAKKDVLSLTEWIKHLNNKYDGLKGDVNDIYEEISSVKSELEELKNEFAAQSAMGAASKSTMTRATLDSLIDEQLLVELGGTGEIPGNDSFFRHRLLRVVHAFHGRLVKNGECLVRVHPLLADLAGASAE